MAVLEIVHYGDPILRKKCKSVKDLEDINSIISDMFDSMYEAEGIGLAANQVGLDMNLFIIDVTHTEEADETHIFINGSIVSKQGEDQVFQEGCLSMPGIALDVTRPEKVTLKYQTPDGEWHEDEFGGLLGRAIQHEMDHLKGLLICDENIGSELIDQTITKEQLEE